MTYDITFADRGSVVYFAGVVSVTDIHSTNEKLYGSAEFDQHKYTIWNFLDADLTHVTLTDADEAAATDWASGMSVPSMRVALVVQEDHGIALCEHYRKKLRELGSSWECQLFDSMTKAQIWVDS